MNIFIAMSGGTTTVINATLTGVLTKILETKIYNTIYIGNNHTGILGLINDNLKEFKIPNKEYLTKMKRVPGSGFIGTTRIHKLTDIDFIKIKDVITKYNIKCIINIGGSGTYKQTCSISDNIKNINIIFLPKTVDNDIGDITFNKLFYTPGFPSCVKYWLHKMEIYNEENLGAYQHDKVLITQTFGRETGFIAGSVRLYDPHRKLPLIILLPEDLKPVKVVINEIKKYINKFGRCIVVMSEGYKIGDIGKNYDKSGQIQYGSSSTTNAQLLVQECLNNNIQARSNIPSFDQRVEYLLSCENDYEISFNIGYNAINYLINNKNKHFYIGIDKDKNINFYKLDNTLDYSRNMLKEWIDYDNFDVTDEYLKYLKALIIK